jgi:hypothetical protein
MKTYRITLLGLPIDTSVCPPDIVSAIFPAFDGWTVTMSSEEILVTAPTPQTPADLGPLVKVELVTSPSN